VPDINVKRLTDCAISADGESISLRLADQGGNASTVRLSIENAGALTMTLPRLIEQALKTKFRDDSLRYAFPLEIVDARAGDRCDLGHRHAAHQ
jgi:hypothetical protein